MVRGGNLADHFYSIPLWFLLNGVTRSVLELQKIYLHENWSEFHQNLIGLIRKVPLAFKSASPRRGHGNMVSGWLPPPLLLFLMRGLWCLMNSLEWASSQQWRQKYLKQDRFLEIVALYTVTLTMCTYLQKYGPCLRRQQEQRESSRYGSTCTFLLNFSHLISTKAAATAFM